jgi:histidinol phosphatase-like PHP family hydrolase
MVERVGKVLTVDDVRRVAHPAYPYMLPEILPISEAEAYKHLRGVVDMHLHGAPTGWMPHRPSMLETSREASLAGMKALVFKDHYYMTSPIARAIQDAIEGWCAEREITPVEVYGGITLNYAVGGLNPVAVKTALKGDFKQKTKVIWMPSVDSDLTRRAANLGPGITILENGKLRREAAEIVEAVASSDTKVSIETSHLYFNEILALAEECERHGVDLVVTHANQELTLLTVDEAAQVVERKAWIQLAIISMLGTPLAAPGWVVNYHHSMELLKSVGPDRIILASDAGQTGARPVEYFKMGVWSLLARDISPDVVAKISSENPSKVLGLR